MGKGSLREVGGGEGILVELRGMLLFSSLAHALALGMMILLAAYLPPRRPEVPVYTVNLVDLAGPTGKARGSKKGRPSREVVQRKGKERPKGVFLPKPKEEKREVKKAELLKKPEPKKIQEEPKKVVLAEKEKKVERVEKKEPARETEPAVKETKREDKPIRREEEERLERKGNRGEEGTPEKPPPAVNPLVISSGSGGDGGVYKGSLFLDNSFPFKSYLVRIQDKIGAHWKPVGGYLAPEGEKRVVVAFKILKDGHIDGLQVEKPSGISFLDQSALRAVFNAQPFPPLPGDFNQESLGVHFDFAYVDEG